jgi:hypothetical protein
MGPFERCGPPLGFCQRGDTGALALVKRKVGNRGVLGRFAVFVRDRPRDGKNHRSQNSGCRFKLAWLGGRQ